MRKLEDKRVLITGASTGIGRAVALELASHGAHVAINYYPNVEMEDKAEELAREICAEVSKLGCDTLLLAADVSKEEEVSGMFQAISDEWGSLDVLVNNAGIQKRCPSHEVSLEAFKQVFDTNALGTFLCSKEAIRMFLKDNIKGVVINNTSVHQDIPKPEYLSYSMSKGAVENLTKTLALEYASYGIRFNNVAPGAIMTPINPWANDEEKKKQISRHIPMHEVGAPEYIAKTVLFLASEDSHYMTGQTLFVDGGLTLYPDFSEDWSSS